MTIYRSGPDGKMRTFADVAEVEAFKLACREAEPPLLRAMLRHRSDIHRLQELVEQALTQRYGRKAALTDIRTRLSGLWTEMSDEIEAARRDVPYPEGDIER